MLGRNYALVTCHWHASAAVAVVQTYSRCLQADKPRFKDAV